MAIAGWILWAGASLPDTRPLWAPDRSPLIIIQDRHGGELWRTGGRAIQRANLDALPPHLPHALIAVEDRRYYHHPGFDLIGLARAMRENIRAGQISQGGSTLTQQLAKNVFLTRQQTLKRKTQEIMLAVWLEHRLTKREIIETYLAHVYFGGGERGIESGAKRYFHKDAAALSAGESAMLAGLLQAPDALNPLKHLAASSHRTAFVIEKMRAQRYMTDAEANHTLTGPIEVQPNAPESRRIAPYFTDWIMREVEKTIGPAQTDIVVKTSLDPAWQNAAEAAIARHVTGEVQTARNLTQAALVAADGTGEVRAMVGGTDYQAFPFNRAAHARRQPGSAFKPFVFLTALQNGYTPWSAIEDQKIDIDGWSPENFSGRFYGPMTLSTAMAKSVNTAAVQLGETVGRAEIIKTAARHGLKGLAPYASLSLGAQETDALSLLGAYIPFSNHGHHTGAYGLRAIYTASGETLYRRPTQPFPKIIEAGPLGFINLMLRRVVTDGTAKSARIPGWDAAGKTGTTNDFRDAWFAGFVPDKTAIVWTGNDDNSPMRNVTGGTVPARIWRDFMSAVLKDRRPAPLPMARMPDNLPPIAALETITASGDEQMQ